MKTASNVCGLLLAAWALICPAPVAGHDTEPVFPKQLTIYGDYAEAYRAAQQEHRMLVIYFKGGRTGTSAAFETQVLTDKAIQDKLQRYVVARIPTSATGMVHGKTVRFLDHPAFAEMQGRPGVAIVDLANTESRQYGQVVSVFPFKTGRFLNRQYFSEMLNLPPGTLTQRTLIFAVRVHPERPASTSGRHSTFLASESESHSRHQASIGVQGHHNWDYRFQKISGRLGLPAQEVCAESWPNQDLVEAAFECVDSWRQSPGHWSALRSRNAYFGFDMKRGRNGIWYGTGIFARR